MEIKKAMFAVLLPAPAAQPVTAIEPAPTECVPIMPDLVSFQRRHFFGTAASPTRALRAGKG
jgi:hypothetical protein